MPFSRSCASAVVYYYFQGFSAGHKRIISYSSTWQKYFILPPFQRWTQVKVIMTWFITVWMDDGELIAHDRDSCNAAYETKYKLTENFFDEVKKSFMWQHNALIKSSAEQVIQTFSFKRPQRKKNTGLKVENESWMLSERKDPRWTLRLLFFLFVALFKVFWLTETLSF